MSDTPNINPAELTLADLKAGDPPPAGPFPGRPGGLRAKFKELIKQNPGVWYEYPVQTTGGTGEHNRNNEGFEWTTRSVANGEPGKKRLVRTWARYNPKTETPS